MVKEVKASLDSGGGDRVGLLRKRMAKNLLTSLIQNSSVVIFDWIFTSYPSYLSFLYVLALPFLISFSVNICSLSCVSLIQISIHLIKLTFYSVDFSAAFVFLFCLCMLF